MIKLILFFFLGILLTYGYYNSIKDYNFYIRIGEIPENETSKIHRGDAIIGEEKGVSVYNAVKINNLWHIVMPPVFKEGQGHTYEALIQNVTECRFRIDSPQKVYLVKGKVVGNGSDFEPVIKNVKIIKDLTEQFKLFQKPTEYTLEQIKEIEKKHNNI